MEYPIAFVYGAEMIKKMGDIRPHDEGVVVWLHRKSEESAYNTTGKEWVHAVCVPDCVSYSVFTRFLIGAYETDGFRNVSVEKMRKRNDENPL